MNAAATKGGFISVIIRGSSQYEVLKWEDNAQQQIERVLATLLFSRA